MKKLSTLGLSLATIAILGLSGCGGSSSGGTTTDKTFNATSFTEDVDGILSTQTSTPAKAKTYFKHFSLVQQAYADDINLVNFKNFWNGSIATSENSDSLMGFIHQNVKVVLNALETANWDYSKNGAGTLSIEMDNGTEDIPYYSKPITVENGKGSKIYFGVNEKGEYENINISTDTIPENGYIVLTLKEVNNIKTFYWVDMEQYTDRDSSEWEVVTLNGKEYIKYKRESDEDEYKYFPDTNRVENGVSGGRAILYIVDENEKEIYFEHLTSTEKHNRQEHYTIKLTNLSDNDGRLRINSSSSINFTRVAREYFNTDIDGLSVDLVNDTNNSQVTYDILQGTLIDGMKYAHSENGVLENENGCFKFDDDLDYNNLSSSTSCSSTIDTLPTLTSNFNTYKSNPSSNVYLPATGSSYDTLDLRVNMFSIYNDNYDGSWMANLDVSK